MPTSRYRRAQLSNERLVLPKVWLPPFRETRFICDEVQDLKKTGDGLVLITRRGSFKLSKLLCKDDFGFATTPRNYLRARDWAMGRWTDIRRERKLRRWHQQNQRRASQAA